MVVFADVGRVGRLFREGRKGFQLFFFFVGVIVIRVIWPIRKQGKAKKRETRVGLPYSPSTSSISSIPISSKGIMDISYLTKNKKIKK